MKKTRFIQLLLIAMIPAALCAMPSWKPDDATIHKLEASIAIPKQSYGHQHVLSEYARFYAGYMKDGHRMIHGELILPEDSKMKPAGAYIVDSESKLPLIFDGGCGIVNLTYDVETNQIVALKCNGVA